MAVPILHIHIHTYLIHALILLRTQNKIIADEKIRVKDMDGTLPTK